MRAEQHDQQHHAQPDQAEVEAEPLNLGVPLHPQGHQEAGQRHRDQAHGEQAVLRRQERE